jgi:hypothetical protein
MVNRFTKFCVLILTVIVQILPRQVWAAGEGLDIPEALERKVSVEGLSGIPLFFAQMYNDNLLLYAIVCTVLMAVVGMAIALVTDVVLKIMGMEVGKIQHHE